MGFAGVGAQLKPTVEGRISPPRILADALGMPVVMEPRLGATPIVGTHLTRWAARRNPPVITDGGIVSQYDRRRRLPVKRIWMIEAASRVPFGTLITVSRNTALRL